MKWSLLVVLLSVVVLGLPHRAFASPPSVSAPTGPQSGGVFTGAFSFDTYVACQSGVTFNNQYTSNLDGTNNFNFVGSPDGSLLVRINGGGAQLLTSCGDPFATPQNTVASYTVSKNTGPPPTPTPTPTATPSPTPTPGSTPTPTPSGGGGGGSGGTGGTTHTGATPTPNTGAPTATPVPGEPTPMASVAGSAPAVKKSTTHPAKSPAVTTASSGTKLSSTLVHLFLWFVVLAVVAGVVFLLARSRRFRIWLADRWLVAKIRLSPYAFRLKLFVKHGLRIHGREIPKRRGLAHHHHTGRVLAHHHTSYPALAFLMLFSTVLLAAYSMTSRADSSGSSLLSLTVLGPPPSQAPTIDLPVDGQHVVVSTLTVNGTCLSGLIVSLSRNGIFAGSTICDGGGSYSLLISLVSGQNDLVARQLDGLGQPSPDSATVTVFYDAPLPTPTPSPTPTPTAPATPTPGASPTPTTTPRPTVAPAASPAPLYITSDRPAYQGEQVGSPVTIALVIKGGVTPYTGTWDWGDGSTQNFTSTDGNISQSHVYKTGGSFNILVRVHDALRHEAVMSLVAVVRGDAVAATRGPDRDGTLLIAWPLLGATCIVLLSFWLGEHHKLALLKFSGPELPGS